MDRSVVLEVRIFMQMKYNIDKSLLKYNGEYIKREANRFGDYKFHDSKSQRLQYIQYCLLHLRKMRKFLPY